MNWEFQFLDFCQTLHTPLLDRIVPAISSLGNAGWFWIAMAAVLLLIPKYRRTGLIVAAALLCDLILCNGIVKPLAGRIRPYEINTSVTLLVKKLTDYSFPSGHTAVSFASAAALFFAGRRNLWKAAGILAVLIALSRLYLYVHYPTDVLGGVVLGIFCGWLGWKIVERAEPVIRIRMEKRKAKKMPD